jgi:hypothetical protein
MTDGDHLKLAADPKALGQLIRAIREGYQVLKALNITITPANHRIFNWLPTSILVRITKRSLKSDRMADLIGHANAARHEMKQIADEFKLLARSAAISTPALDQLFPYF